MGLNVFEKQPQSYSKKKEYKFLEVLGQGSFGSVKKAIWLKKNNINNESNIPVAIKCIKKKILNGQEQVVHDETAVLKNLDHPNIVKLYDWFESKEKFYLVFELASGGELFQRICDQGRFTEKDAIKVIRMTLSGLEYLHQNNIVHRDLKPENLLYKSSPSESDSSAAGAEDRLMIADFGIAKLLSSDVEVLTTMCGSPGYAAPEVLNNIGHGKPVDLWSIGVITYTLLCGYSPFRSENRAELIKETTKAKVEFHHRYWVNVSDEARHFILSLLKPEPNDRLTAEQALKHKWLTEHVPSDYDLSGGLKSHWGPKKRWKAAINAVVATNRMKSNIESLTTPSATSVSTDSSSETVLSSLMNNHNLDRNSSLSTTKSTAESVSSNLNSKEDQALKPKSK
ncbi:kinase-like domain-containing protein [Phakopsora pachyrhizi]|uniref:Kinase-like domain-containing protein n=1 Tax=Phakopsora pachyrhizi TaxID=170000 RepID=A0AAV0ADS1_PHAPC|nr:kinase-like domain-containing protein [Phakopsora pachyrhizi]CAH7666162.1 kinase-like domain-containing protein [Phakopsora pachyrhizi]CAH7681843.1 kinase-like domain-containing protein [Phakopsora pachyrhizi]